MEKGKKIMYSSSNKRKLFIAILVGILLSLFLNKLINDQKAQVNELSSKLKNQNEVILGLKNQSVTGNTSQQSGYVVLAKKDIVPGMLLTPDMLEVKQISPKDVLVGSFNDINTAVGQSVISNIKTGEAITQSNTVKLSSANFNIPVGMRAITIPVEYIQGLGSYINIGSKVDIISTSASKNNTNKPDIVLQNIKIISFEGSTSPSTLTSPIGATAITFEIPATSAPKLVESMSNGKLQIIVRNNFDNKLIRRNTRSFNNYNISNVSYIKKLSLPPVPQLTTNFGRTGFSDLPSPAIPLSQPSKKVEIIQANIKSEVSFDNN